MRADTAILELQRAPAIRCAVGRSLVRQHGGEEHNAAGFKRHGNGLALVDAVGQDLAVDGVVVSERTKSVAARQDVHTAIVDGGIVQGDPSGGYLL